MTHTNQSTALLPSGLHDTLQEAASARFYSTYNLIDQFMAFGYEPIIPPLLEYNDTMQAASDAQATNQFQLQDPYDGRMLGLRANITPQIARIAQTSLKNAPRPLRLCYAGPRILTKAESLKTGREHLQIGLELIGAKKLNAEAEVIAIAVAALKSLGLPELSLDIHLPKITRTLLAKLPKSDQAAALLAVKRKDGEALKQLGANTLLTLLDAHGDIAHFNHTLKQQADGKLTDALNIVNELSAAINEKGCDVPVTIDASDIEYGGGYEGVSFSIFTTNPALEIARGGRYRLQNGEEAVGFTVYLEQILAQLPQKTVPSVAAVANGVTLSEVQALQAQGYKTIYAEAEGDKAELKKMGATHIYNSKTIEEL